MSFIHSVRSDYILSRLYDAKELLEKAANIMLDVDDALADPAFRPHRPGIKEFRSCLEDIELATSAAARNLDYARTGSAAALLAKEFMNIRREQIAYEIEIEKELHALRDEGAV